MTSGCATSQSALNAAALIKLQLYGGLMAQDSSFASLLVCLHVARNALHRGFLACVAHLAVVQPISHRRQLFCRPAKASPTPPAPETSPRCRCEASRPGSAAAPRRTRTRPWCGTRTYSTASHITPSERRAMPPRRGLPASRLRRRRPSSTSSLRPWSRRSCRRPV